MQIREFNPIQSRALQQVLRFALPVCTVVIASFLGLALRPYLSNGRFMPVTIAVVFSTWFSGFWGGVFSGILSIPLLNILIDQPSDRLIESALFTLVVLLIAGIGGKRQNAQAKLTDVTTRLYAIIDSIADGISVRDSDGHLVMVNKKLVQDMGYADAKSLLNDSIYRRHGRFTMYNTQGELMLYDQLPHKQVFAENRTIETTLRGRNNQSGEDRWYSLRVSPVHDQKGKARYVVSIIHDITSLRRAEELETESIKRVRDVLDNIRPMVALIAPDGKILEMNLATLETARLRRDEVIGIDASDTYWWNYSEESKNLLQWAVERARSGASVRMDARVRIADGKFMDIDFMIAPIHDKGGTLKYLLASGMDITERKQKENELRALNERLTKQENRLKLILENVPGLIWEMYRESESQTVEFVSDYAQTILGYPSSSWNGTGDFWRTICYPEDVPGATEKLTAIVSSGKPGSYEVRCIHRDGYPVPLEAHISPLRNEQNIPVGICGVFMDLTERKKYEAQLAEQADSLRRYNAELELFIYLASHDLQEPLRMVASYLQLIEQRYGDRLDEDAKEFIGYAVDGAARMKMLINDLLAYSRVNREETNFTSVNIEKVLLRTLNILRLSIEETHAEITYDSLPSVAIGNESQLIQVFQNLIGNALKFRRDDSPKIHIGVREEEQQWVFSVTDNGIGIEEQFLERIFIIFQRLHSKAKYPGTGIGLAICKRVVENHRGKIWAESALNIGTTIYFTLPCS